MRHTVDQWNSTSALLRAHNAPTGREKAWAEALTFLDEGRRGGVHLLASVFVIDADGRVLLARHRRYGKWGPLGGHMDRGDANLRATADRELLEEAALAALVNSAPIDTCLSSYPCRTTTEPVLHLDVRFAAFADTSAPALVANNELMALEWFDARRLPAPLIPNIEELVGLATAAVI